MLGVHLEALRGAKTMENVERAAPKKTGFSHRTGSAFKYVAAGDHARNRFSNFPERTLK